MTIPYIGVFGQYESSGKTHLVCHVGLKHLTYNDDKTALLWDGTIIAYGKAVLIKEGDGSYACESFTLAGDSASESKDLKEFCGPLTDLPNDIYAGLDYTSTFPSHGEENRRLLCISFFSYPFIEKLFIPTILKASRIKK